MSEKEEKLKEYLYELIDERIAQKDLDIKKEDAEKIVKFIIPYLDELISKRVKEHFVALGNFIKKTFSWGSNMPKILDYRQFCESLEEVTSLKFLSKK